MIAKNDILRMWIDSEQFFALTTDGRQHKTYTLSHSGIHWLELDEDLTLDGMFRSNHLN